MRYRVYYVFIIIYDNKDLVSFKIATIEDRILINLDDIEHFKSYYDRTYKNITDKDIDKIIDTVEYINSLPSSLQEILEEYILL